MQLAKMAKALKSCRSLLVRPQSKASPSPVWRRRIAGGTPRSRAILVRETPWACRTCEPSKISTMTASISNGTLTPTPGRSTHNAWVGCEGPSAFDLRSESKEVACLLSLSAWTDTALPQVTL